MTKVLTSRRYLIAMAGIISLLTLGLVNGVDVSLAITGIVASVAGANAYEGKKSV